MEHDEDIIPHAESVREIEKNTKQFIYRSFLINDCDNYRSLYFVANIKIDNMEGTEYNYSFLPPETHFYAIDNHSVKHGSYCGRKENRRKLILIIYGILDEKQHIRLLEKSKSKYNTYCIKKSLNDITTLW